MKNCISHVGVRLPRGRIVIAPPITNSGFSNVPAFFVPTAFFEFVSRKMFPAMSKLPFTLTYEKPDVPEVDTSPPSATLMSFLFLLITTILPASSP